ncbi:MAG: hypothetical protein A2Z45_10870 [Chloroflexi bacterium RBG_19FT_COMBO_55_16]|nr:MAG: hypothetical protein A2Z45_10870 [Chloroflexi bacterium RBG_19FT_COMBO_55_16]
MATSESRRYSRQGLWSLFLMCAFPLHVWTIILAFRDFSWVTERTNAWDAIGVISYGMVFALIESLAVFLVAVLLGFMVSRKFDEGRRIALLSVLVLITALWAMASQLYFLWGISLPEQMMRFLAQSGHPVRVLYAASLALVLPTVLIPAFLVLKSNKVFNFVRELTERLSLLTMFYLVLDVGGLVIVLIRNL